MKVRDLMAALGELDPDLLVIIPDQNQDFTSPDRIVLDVVAPCRDGSLQLCDYEDDGATTVARLMGPAEHDDRDERPKPPAH